MAAPIIIPKLNSEVLVYTVDYRQHLNTVFIIGCVAHGHAII